ncbi:MAG: hypothetical protein WC776_00805 [Patescibacteria group bacterium]
MFLKPQEFSMESTVIDALRSLLCRRLGIPVPYSKLFGESELGNCRGEVVEGDALAPPTNVPDWSRWLNLLHWAWLAMFMWKKYAIFQVCDGSDPYRVMFRTDVHHNHRDPHAWTVMPQRIRTRFVAMKIGHEPVEFAMIDQRGTLIFAWLKECIFGKRAVLDMIRRYITIELTRAESIGDLGRVIVKPSRYLTIL